MLVITETPIYVTFREKEDKRNEDSTGKESRREGNGTEQNVSIQARKICLLGLKFHRVIISLYKRIRQKVSRT